MKVSPALRCMPDADSRRPRRRGEYLQRGRTRGFGSRGSTHPGPVRRRGPGRSTRRREQVPHTEDVEVVPSAPSWTLTLTISACGTWTVNRRCAVVLRADHAAGRGDGSSRGARSMRTRTGRRSYHVPPSGQARTRGRVRRRVVGRRGERHRPRHDVGEVGQLERLGVDADVLARLQRRPIGQRRQVGRRVAGWIDDERPTGSRNDPDCGYRRRSRRRSPAASGRGRSPCRTCRGTRPSAATSSARRPTARWRRGRRGGRRCARRGRRCGGART